MNNRTLTLASSAVLLLSLAGARTGTAGIADFNFNDGLTPPGTGLAGTASIPAAGGVGDSGFLNLNNAANSQVGGFSVADLDGGAAVTSLEVRFDVRIGGSTCCTDAFGVPRPADGFSFNFGTDVSFGVLPAVAEEGTGSGLIVSFDTWDNGGADSAPAIEVSIGGTVVATQSMAEPREGGRAHATPLITDPATGQPMLFTTGSTFAPVHFRLNANKTFDLFYKDVLIFDGIAIPGYTPQAGADIVIASRTGGANETHHLDNLSIITGLTHPKVRFYGIDPVSPTLHVINSQTLATVSATTITHAGGSTVTGGTGLTRHPHTGELFAILKIQGQTGRELVTLDPATGVATSIGNTGDDFAGITFDAAGVLHAITGHRGPAPESYFTLDLSTGAASLSTTIIPSLAGSDGEAIAFNSADGLLYHASGRSSSFAFEAVDPATGAITSIPHSGFPVDEVQGMVYLGGGLFLATDLNEAVVTITTTGFVTRLDGATAVQLRGLALVDPKVLFYGIDPFTPTLHVIDSETLATVSATAITHAGGGTVTGGTGLTRHPHTGELFAILKIAGQTGRELVTLDPATGGATSIGNTGDDFAGITFDAAGVLHAITGNRGPAPESYFTLDPSSGAATLSTTITPSLAGNDGEAIAFNPDNGLLYHASGRDSDFAFEAVNPATGAITNIPRSGFPVDEVQGMAYLGAGLFLATDLDEAVVTITTTGFVTRLAGVTAAQLRGLALVAPRVHFYGIEPGSPRLHLIDSATLATVSSTTITHAGGGTVTGGTGLTRHPLTGELFAILKLEGQSGRELVTLDSTTGIATSSGNTGQNFAGISFDAGGVLHGITGDGGSPSESYFTIDTSTGAATLSTTITPSLAGNDGEVIAFNPDDGLLYHASGISQFAFEAVNPATGAITNCPLSGFPVNEVVGMVYLGGDLFLATDLSRNVVSITTTGFVTRLGGGVTDARLRGLALSASTEMPASAELTVDGFVPGTNMVQITITATPGPDLYLGRSTDGMNFFEVPGGVYNGDFAGEVGPFNPAVNRVLLLQLFDAPLPALP